MKRLFAIILSLVMIISGVCVYQPVSSVTRTIAAEKADFVQGEALISLELKDGEDSELIHEGLLRSDPTIMVKHVMDFGKGTYISVVKSGRYTADRLISKLKKYKNVKLTALNHQKKKKMSTNDPLFNDQWHLGGNRYFNENSSLSIENSIGYTPETAAPADKDIPVVAVVDDGVDYNHEDMKNKMWVNPFPADKLPGKHGYDCINDDDDPFPDLKGDDHGTKIAGIIAAETDNGIGISGVSRYAKIMALKVFDGDNITTEAELGAYEYIYKAQKLGVNVVAVNCSFGYAPSSTPFLPDDKTKMTDLAFNAIGSMGAVITAAAGNETTDLDENPYGFPYEQDRTYMILVGATDYNGEASSFSNWGKKGVDIFAPGDNILTTVNHNEYLPEVYTDEQKKEKCIVYETFDTADTKFKTIEQVTGKETSFLSLDHVSDDYHCSKNSGSEKVYFKTRKNPSAHSYCLYYDVTDYHLNPLENMRVSFDLIYRIRANGTIEWDNIGYPLGDTPGISLFTYKSRTFLCLDLKLMYNKVSDRLGQFEYFDNLTISKPVTEQSSYVQYTFAGGTSFSAPVIAGAIARLAVMYPDDNALTRKARLLASVKQTPDLVDKCVTGGILDMSKFADQKNVHVDSIVYKVKKIELDQEEAKLKVGKKLTLKATVTPKYATNDKVSWKVSNSKYATVTSSGVVTALKKGKGHTVTVTATAKDGSGKKASCKIKIVK